MSPCARNRFTIGLHKELLKVSGKPVEILIVSNLSAGEIMKEVRCNQMRFRAEKISVPDI